MNIFGKLSWNLMMIHAKNLFYKQKFKLPEKESKFYILKHKKPMGFDSVALYTDKGVLILEENEVVKVYPTEITYKNGSWICECLCINPRDKDRCMNRECRKRIPLWQNPDSDVTEQTLKRREYRKQYYLKRKGVNKKVDLSK